MANTAEVNYMVNSALYIYASAKDCGKGKPAHKCVADIAPVVKSALGVGKFLMKALETCGEIKTANFDCAIAAHSLTMNLAGVTQNTALLSKDCQTKDSMTETGSKRDWDRSAKATCTADLGTGTANLQAAITSMMTVKGKCDTGKGEKCFAAVLDIISAVGNLALFIDTIVADCSSPIVSVTNPCETDVMGVISALSATASTSLTIKSKCTAGSTRALYQDIDAPMASNGGTVASNFATALLVVLLPVTGFASYYGGSKLSTRRQARHTILRSEAPEFE